MIERLINYSEAGLIPESLIRLGIRRLLRKRLQQVDQGNQEANLAQTDLLIDEFSAGPIAVLPEKANQQHYEVPQQLFELTLGPQLKYSSCFFSEPSTSLEDAETFALNQTCQRAEIADGMSVLELGCGWGSLSLWMAQKYPNSKLTVVSNSSSQRIYIEAKAKRLGVEKNLNVITNDINDFDTESKFDRVVSVEMFEHVRNHKMLMQRISDWLTPQGKLFLHVFCHKELTYPFQDDRKDDWMSRHFFSGGIMPGQKMLLRFQDDLLAQEQWAWNGTHYQRTCEAWLANMKANREQIMPILTSTYGRDEARRWFNRWKMFYLACSELFGFNGGNEWLVAHYLFGNRE